MKYLLAIVMLCAVSAQAQLTTNNPTGVLGGIQLISDAVTGSTNWTVLSGYGHSLTKQNNIGFVDLAYNLNNNVGLVGGYDDLWNSKTSQANAVKGGLTLQMQIHPFAFMGSTYLTNIVATPFVADLMATPNNSSSGIGNIIDTGASFHIYQFMNFQLGAEVHYENRSGQGDWNANYLMGSLSISRRF